MSRDNSLNLSRLVRVLSVGQVQTISDITMMLLSIELYDDGFVMIGKILGSRRSEDDERIGWYIVFDAQSRYSVDDDQGGRYAPLRGQAGGNGHEFRFAYGFTPSLDPRAKELRVEFSELAWMRLDRNDRSDRSGDVHVRGPWVFLVPIPPFE